MLALTAATPIFKGRLVDCDVRWTAISQSTDDRTPAERSAASASAAAKDPAMSGGGVRPLAKSRYDSVSVFLCEGTPECYNDVPCEVDEATRGALLNAGLDPTLARHVGHLFARDPLVMFQGRIAELPDDGTRTDHWESLQSTNWQTMRWKPPPPRDPAKPLQPHIGWRTEFRSMEVQLTDFENAACTVFIVLLTRTVLVFDLDLLMPLSKIDENMARAHCRQPVKTQTWWFRKDITPGALAGRRPSDAGARKCPSCPEAAAAAAASGNEQAMAGQHCEPSDLEEMSMIQVLQGKGAYFPGLIPLCYAYLEHIACDSETFARVDAYLGFLTARARGDVVTCADWVRNFVASHPDYKGDSVVGDTVAHDLMVKEARAARECLRVCGAFECCKLTSTQITYPAFIIIIILFNYLFASCTFLKYFFKRRIKRNKNKRVLGVPSCAGGVRRNWPRRAQAARALRQLRGEPQGSQRRAGLRVAPRERKSVPGLPAGFGPGAHGGAAQKSKLRR
jgi:glutamate--cysteine ligase catalytic subunit